MVEFSSHLPNMDSGKNMLINAFAAAAGTAIVFLGSKKVTQIPAPSTNAMAAAIAAGTIGASVGQYAAWAAGKDQDQAKRIALSAALAALAIAPFSLEQVQQYIPVGKVSMNTGLALAGAVGVAVAAATYFNPALKEYEGKKADLDKLLTDYKAAKQAYEADAQALHKLQNADNKDADAIKAAEVKVNGKAEVKEVKDADGNVTTKGEAAVKGSKEKYEAALEDANKALNHKFSEDEVAKAAKSLREEVAKKLELTEKK